MNKKRVLAMLLAGAMALSMTACGGNSASTDDSSNDGGASASGGSYKVSVILKTLAAEYWQYVKSGAEDYASEHSDKVTVEVKGPSSETAFDEMQNMIETDLSSGSYDGVIISPLQSDTAAQLVSGTKLPIVAIDTNFTAPEVKSFVGTGNEAAAKKGGEAAVEAAKAAGWTDIKCIEIAGVHGDQKPGKSLGFAKILGDFRQQPNGQNLCGDKYEGSQSQRKNRHPEASAFRGFNRSHDLILIN